MGWLREQFAQGVVGDGPAVRRVCDEGHLGLGRPGVFVPSFFIEAAGHGRYGFLAGVRMGITLCPGILPASGPGEPPGPVSGSQWLPLRPVRRCGPSSPPRGAGGLCCP